MFISRSTRGNKFAKSSTAQKYETQYDIGYVRDRFPMASKTSYLVERLGKANAQKRQWLSYRRRHREKLAIHPEAEEPEASFDGQPDVGGFREGLETNINTQTQCPSPRNLAEDHRDSRSMLSSTKASTFHQHEYMARDTVETERSETSYSETSFGEHGQDTNFVPQPPPESND